MTPEVPEKKRTDYFMLDRETKEWIRLNFASAAKFDEPMSGHTSLRVGGPAELFIKPEHFEDAIAIMDHARKKEIPLFTAGGGTNLLVSDTGIEGIVLNLSGIEGEIQMEELADDTVRLTVPSGTHTARLCRFALDNGLEGMNFALGIPGTVGGAVAVNAGTAGGCMADVLESVEVFTDAVKQTPADEIGFSYRSSSLKRSGGNGPVILNAVFTLPRVNRDRLKKEARALLEKRNTCQPVTLPSAGCFFKNPSQESPAGKLIDGAGLKGKRIGGAEISERHANFIVNRGNATSGDILALMELARDEVSARFGIDLETEVQIVGA